MVLFLLDIYQKYALRFEVSWNCFQLALLLLQRLTNAILC